MNTNLFADCVRRFSSHEAISDELMPAPFSSSRTTSSEGRSNFKILSPSSVFWTSVFVLRVFLRSGMT